MMSYAHYIKEIGRGEHGSRDLSERDAYQLYSAMLDGGVPDLELGAIILSMRNKTESLTELIGMYRAASERLHYLTLPSAQAKPLVIPTYNGARHQANLLPLLVLLLKRFGIPVLLHGCLESNGRVATAYILRELGIMPSVSLGAAQKALNEEGVAFAPTALVSPGLANLLALRTRLGVRNSAHALVKLIDPFNGAGLRLVSVSHPAYLEKMRAFFAATGHSALLMRGTEGEAFANPKRRPQIEYFNQGAGEILFEAEAGTIKSLPDLPDNIEAGTTAKWIATVLAGKIPVPYPLLNQLACCFYASGYSDDFNQAKAIVAMETGTRAAA
jgi:anthranilate phosphoribosyltransferase